MAANVPSLAAAPARSRLRDRAAARTPGPARWRALALPVAVSVVALAAVAWWASTQQLPTLPSAEIALPRIGAALALYALATLLRGERWLRLRRDGGDACTRADAYALTTVGYMGNNALPARAGDVLKAVFTARRSDAPTLGAVGTLVAERLLDAAALVLLFGVLVTTLRLPLGVPGWVLAAVGAGLLLVAIAAAVLGRRTAAGQRLQALVVSVLTPTRRLASPTGAALLALSVVLWLVEGSIYAVLGAVAGLHLSLLDGLYIMALANLVALVPAAPGYVGTFDAAIILGVRLVAGGTQAAALAYAVVVRFTLFVPITLVGLAALIVRYGGISRLRAALASGRGPQGSPA
ncbi:MAG: lysylphosphatidylglycerol synthase transmembrane domain-containing protein [Solirubrobacteraceae bacterium]